MANHKSALKRIKQNEARNARNRHHRSTLKTYIKKVREAVAAKNHELAQSALSQAIPVIDKAATKGVIHKANASRNISRLTRLVNTLG
ncbi:MAG: 30S ribosomal protein S20 [Desulfuromonadia bacterium]